jgi:hypothetical protein
MNTKDEGFKKALASLYKSMSERLNIKDVPRTLLVDSKKNAKLLLGGTGSYNGEDKTIRLYTTNRHPKDVLRTFAHEVIHHWQQQNGKLDELYKDKESDKDPQYAQNDPHLRKMEKQAYLLGNVLFRDWEDDEKNKNGSEVGQLQVQDE